MLSRTGVLVFGLGFTAGLIAFGCASASRRESAGVARAQAQPSAAPPPVPVQPASWSPATSPANPSATVAASDSQGPSLTPASNPPPPAAPPLPVNPANSSNAVPQAPAPVSTPSATVQPGGQPLPSAAPITEPRLSPEESAAKVRELYRQAAASYAKIDSYFARLRRREEVGGRPKPEEMLLFKFRKQPWSVYFKWLGEEGKGREALFVKGQHDSKLHTLLAAGDMPFTPAGKRIALDPESILVRSRSRHAVREAGIGHIIEEMGKQIQDEEQHKKVRPVRYLGLVRRPEYVAPLEAIEQTIPPNTEAGPEGGTRQVFFDPAIHLPVLIVTLNAKGRELEYYCYDRLLFPVHLDDDDFNPDKLWKPLSDGSEKRR